MNHLSIIYLVLVMALSPIALSQPADSIPTESLQESPAQQSASSAADTTVSPSADALLVGNQEEQAPPSQQAEEATTNNKTLAVLYFENTGADSTYNPLQRALTDMIITDLAQVSALTLVERERMSSLMMEKELQISDVVAQDTRVKFSRELKVRRLLTGKFSVDADKNLNIKTAYIDAKDNKIVKLAGVNGAVDKFFDLEKKLVFGILSKMNITISDEERKKIQVIKTENLLAALAYGSGLEAQDRGNFSQAQQAFAKAFVLDPKFKQAGVMAKKASASASQSRTTTSQGSESQDEAAQEEPVISDNIPVSGGAPVDISGSSPMDKPTTAAPGSDSYLEGATVPQPEAKTLGSIASQPAVTPLARQLSAKAGGAFMPEVPVTAGKDKAATTAVKSTSASSETQTAGAQDAAPAAESAPMAAPSPTQDVRAGFAEANNLGLDNNTTVKISIPIPELP